IRKEKELTDEQKRKTVKEYSLTKGFFVALFSGIMSACFAFAISAGEGVAAAAVAAGTRPIFQNNPVFILIMAGGFTTNCIWCLILNLRNKSIRDYVTGTGRLLVSNYLFSALAGVIWYGQFFFYGMGTTKMGGYDFSSWSIHMAFIIVFSNLWGIYFKEWKGVSRRTWTIVLAGLAVLIFSTVIIGWGNFLASH
ncbi:MAG: rhamnose/proton symporter RhaT, partial [Candidatus Aminicenantes bacterium]|nr:rhamnose/proton symporter RhaT [Candidatus Aminicenantes bacterium]